MGRELGPSVDIHEIPLDLTRFAGQVIDKLRSLLKKGTLDLVPVDLPEVITEVLSLVHADAVARHVDISSSMQPGLPLVRGDRIHLQQGKLNKQIAADLGIHERTVKFHCTHVTTKLGVHSVAELTRLVQDAGLE